MGELGTIYLLHFDRPFGHAQHYLGWTQDLFGRLSEHRKGSHGAKIVQHARKAGIGFELVRVWENQPRLTERRVKEGGGLGRQCPICGKDSHAARKRKQAKQTGGAT